MIRCRFVGGLVPLTICLPVLTGDGGFLEEDFSDGKEWVGIDGLPDKDVLSGCFWIAVPGLETDASVLSAGKKYRLTTCPRFGLETGASVLSAGRKYRLSTCPRFG